MKINNNLNYLSAVKAQQNANAFKSAARPQGSQVAFGGAAAAVAQKAPSAITKGIGAVIEKAGNTNLLKKMAHLIGNSKFGYTHLLTIESVILTGFYMSNTAKNDKIKKEQKLPLMINDALVTVFSAVCNYTLDGFINKKIKSFQNVFKQLNKNVDEKTLNKYLTGIDKFKSIVIFTMIYRYLGPVVLTPVANKISGVIQKKKTAKNTDGTETAKTTQPQPQPAAVKTEDAKKAEKSDDHDDDHDDKKKKDD